MEGKTEALRLSGAMLEGRLMSGDLDVFIRNGVIAEISPPGPEGLSSGVCVDYLDCSAVPFLCDFHLHFSEDVVRNVDPVSRLLSSWGIAAAHEAGDRCCSGPRVRTLLSGRVDVSSACRALYRAGGYGRSIGVGVVDAKEAREQIDLLLQEGADFLKIVNSGIYLPKQASVSPGGFGREELREIVQYAISQGLSCSCHANGDQAVRDALDAGCRTIIHGYAASGETVRHMADLGVSLIPTLFAFASLKERAGSDLERNAVEDVLKRHCAMVAEAHQAGVRVLAGSDAAPNFLPYGSSLWEEMRLLASAGIPAETIFGHSSYRQIGRGSPADFLLVRGMELVAVVRAGEELSRIAARRGGL